MTEAIQFSGGKDSLAILYLMRDRLKDVPVYFGNTGHVYPHMLNSVRKTCEKLGADLREIYPPTSIDSYQANFGLPSDIVPVEATATMAAFSKTPSKTRLQASIACCNAMLWQPLYQAMINDGIKTVYRGSKASDHHVGVSDGYIDANGITYRSPIWAWSDEDVLAYLTEVGAELPEHYSVVNNSFDCIYCTAFLNHKGANKRLQWTKKNYPEQWPLIERRLRDLRTTIVSEMETVKHSLSILDGDILSDV